jgi:hypothetical protein
MYDRKDVDRSESSGATHPGGKGGGLEERRESEPVA